MIAELLNLADLNALTGHEPTRSRRIHWFIDLDLDGRVIGFSPTVRQVVTKKGETKEMRGKEFPVFANYHMQVRDEKVTGVCTNQNNWLPDLLCGEIDEVIAPSGSAGKTAKRNHEAWCALVNSAAVAANRSNRLLDAVSRFIDLATSLDDLLSCSKYDKDAIKTALIEKGETVAFRVEGQVVFANAGIVEWWTRYVADQRAEVMKLLPMGADAYQSGDGALTESFPRFIRGIALASFDAAPFVSYGLNNQTSTMRVETAERCAAAMRLLLESRNNSLSLGDYTTIFWTVPKEKENSCGVPFVSVLEEHDPCQVRDYLAGAWGVGHDDIDESQFYAALLHIPSQGRFSVQSWQTDTLRNAKRHMQAYFDAVRLGPDEENVSTIRQLAVATTAKSKKKTVLPAATAVSLFQTALFGAPIPYKLLAQVLGRQQAEMAGKDHKELEFEERLKARTALIRLYFIKNRNKEVLMSTETHEGEKQPAYLCGRLLAILDAIHAEAHPKLGKDGKPMRDRRGIAFCASASSPADRMYGAASKTPALVFPQLCDRVRYHLNKIEAGMAAKLEHGVPSDRRNDGVDQDFDGLAAVVARLKEAAGGSFPRMLSLEDQGRFAIGFYYERCRKWPNFKQKQEVVTTDNGEEN
ncbi:MAG: type I-C CRISPR-associated protein Cas8c/Csd1 [Verrucomicrobia bacterium]|nr:type I-C CRISPR-associated protein Cas8c/Csd1 [Verrucomicrobiota bacterium]MBU4429288.1 type I-C CRISPR-associated protein Cas8c/Csd1 [Verrucomicrobiota bacterium]MBU4497589.1 type I-C CRISPR-associated protein Cas8c/Csd1 [Verrucomicrobiota bacterium]MCG2680747.1 type I-C CRISPR-associated protein Cas8c/Csd1 [Kiritimatiellia bacterium]